MIPLLVPSMAVASETVPFRRLSKKKKTKKKGEKRMNDFVLRGFCQKCGLVVELNSYKEKQWIVHCNPTRNSFCEPDAVWFLSSKQMKIVFGSDEFEKWAGQENYFELCNNAFTLIVKVLEDNPFLVSKILKEAEEKREVKKE